MTDNRQQFLERHPDVTEDELDALSVPRIRLRRWLIAVAIAFAITLITTIGVGLRVNHVVQTDAKVIAAELAQEQVAEVQRVLGARAEAGRELAIRVFEFTVDLMRDNYILRSTTQRWGLLRQRTATLRADVGSLGDTPVASGKRIVRAVPELVDALIVFVGDFLSQLDRLGPQFASALEGTGRALAANEFDPIQLLDALEVGLDPLIGDNDAQRAAWQNLRAEIVAWRVGLDADVAELRAKVDDDTLSREFVARFIDALVGRRNVSPKK